MATRDGALGNVYICVENYGGNMFARVEPHRLEVLAAKDEPKRMSPKAKLYLPMTINSDTERLLKSKMRWIIQFTGELENKYYQLESTCTTPSDDCWDVIHQRVITKNMDIKGGDAFMGVHAFRSDWATEEKCKSFFFVFGRNEQGAWACIVKKSTNPVAFEAAAQGHWKKLRDEIDEVEKSKITLKRVEQRGENTVMEWRKVELITGLKKIDEEEIFEVEIVHTWALGAPCHWM